VLRSRPVVTIVLDVVGAAVAFGDAAGVESTWADDVPWEVSTCVEDAWLDVVAWLELDECELLE